MACQDFEWNLRSSTYNHDEIINLVARVNIYLNDSTEVNKNWDT